MDSYLVFNYSTDPKQLQEAVNFFIKHLEQGHFKSIIGKTYNGIESIIDAYKYLEKSDLFGKIVIKL
ncbi:hypothetical protein DICPUDRAFT_33888 [Dictyostelium purpureum]|uniref:Alcohol dehydrogenase-like C-terminal domain-containing protein n=1 Tax=Dictyostelium purpureum TaxID=5786 RepID=F0ZLN1_DICPU|nr:uncharacterized protein DICPUDRAFT_33888 [Dictyostelium purpureum]EGC35142.1 hypothetical protein DICPUDRAFT_33888 [Dictyostelium purpureum]|eukprot:XP_003288335.1 hypothetical protein DICPUDRAFT_33888 [Dictyostelium purpureum]